MWMRLHMHVRVLELVGVRVHMHVRPIWTRMHLLMSTHVPREAVRQSDSSRNHRDLARIRIHILEIVSLFGLRPCE